MGRWQYVFLFRVRARLLPSGGGKRSGGAPHRDDGLAVLERAARSQRLPRRSLRSVARTGQVTRPPWPAIRAARTQHAVVLCALVLGACAGIGSGADGGQPTVPVRRFCTSVAAQHLRVTAEPALRWSPDELRATAGDITFFASNPPALNYDFTVQGNGINARNAVPRPGSTVTLTGIGLVAGTYRYVRTIPGHEATMLDTFMVK